MKGKKEIWIGLGIFAVLVLIIIGISTMQKNDSEANLTNVYVATGGGKENFIADEEVNNIIKSKYKLNVVYDNWSNGKLIKNTLKRFPYFLRFAPNKYVLFYTLSINNMSLDIRIFRKRADWRYSS